MNDHKIDQLQQILQTTFRVNCCIFWPALGAAQFKTWSKYAFFMFLHEKVTKKNKRKMRRKYPNAGQNIYKRTFSGNTPLGQHFGPNPLHTFLPPFSFSLFLFYIFHAKRWKKHALTSVWGAQHQKAGKNIQQLILLKNHFEDLSYFLTYVLVNCYIYSYTI